MSNPTGIGGFGERPQDINKQGAPKRGQNWQATIKRITDMTREEAIDFVGAKTKIGRLLKELPADIPIKDALVFISIIQYGRDPNPRLLAALMDREEGKPQQPVDITTQGEKINTIGVKLIDYRTGITATEAGSSGDSETSSKDENPGDGSPLG